MYTYGLKKKKKEEEEWGEEKKLHGMLEKGDVREVNSRDRCGILTNQRSSDTFTRHLLFFFYGPTSRWCELCIIFSMMMRPHPLHIQLRAPMIEAFIFVCYPRFHKFNLCFIRLVWENIILNRIGVVCLSCWVCSCLSWLFFWVHAVIDQGCIMKNIISTVCVKKCPVANHLNLT